jgi:hypothetical protein
MEIEAINNLLSGRTDLLGMRLSWNPLPARYEAVLSLAAPGDPRSHINVLFIGLAGLRLREVGQGVAQLMCLRVGDVSDRRWDRVKYEVEDLEHDRLHFYCHQIEVLDTPETRSSEG